MPRRHEDWLRQAKRKLDSARWDLQGAFYEDACFSAHQAAELAAKALLESQGRVETGHSVQALLKKAGVSEARLLGGGRTLDRYYIPTRYPNGFPSGAPMDYYDEPTAQEAIELAARIVEFVEQQIAGL
ncbi:MAG: HEPN domain-containing protein [Candidatus Acetothermia bacterium]|jgi:HEPN domain-containing protein|nr:HEPN domain-containing protein [Candidatus Acetothermia bacterium]MDH7504739.1 HEPN domain-containing protein [Candidatus Acetothermia bacterium]